MKIKELVKHSIDEKRKHIDVLYKEYGIEEYLKCVSNANIYGECVDNRFYVDSIEYSLQCILGISEISGYDFEFVNNVLKLDDMVAVGLVYGDDIVVLNKCTGSVHLLLVETGDYEIVDVAKTFDEFIKNIKPMEEEK